MIGLFFYKCTPMFIIIIKQVADQRDNPRRYFMKITFDTSAFWETGMSYEEIYHTVAEAGFEYISPYDPIFPGFWETPESY